MDEYGRYVYCVINGAEKRTFGRGFNGHMVYTIPYKDISAVVSETSPVEFEPNEANALIHEEVVERAMQDCTVIPLGFGSVFINESRVVWCLARFYWTFKTHLKRLDGKAEVGVKVFYDLEVAKKELEAVENEKPRGSLTSGDPKQDHYKNIGEKAYEYGVKVYDALKKYAQDTRLMKRIGGTMILNGAFLVQKDKVQDFETELGKLETEFADKGLKFQFSGPWPPYNFVQILIRR